MEYFTRKYIEHTILPDIVIRPLLTTDAPTINDLWTYKSAFTLDQITYEIAHFPAFGN